MESVTLFVMYIGLATLIICLGLGVWLHIRNKQHHLKK